MQHLDPIRRMSEFIADVVDYYRRSNYHTIGQLTFSRQMASLALPNLPASEVESCVRQLAAIGVIAIVDERDLTFTPMLYNDVVNGHMN